MEASSDPALVPAERRATRSHRNARRALVAVLVVAALWITQGFLLPLAWAIVLAVTLWPLYRRLTGERGPDAKLPVLLPLALSVLTGLLLILPLGIAAAEGARDSHFAMAFLRDAQAHGVAAPGWLANVPLVGGRALGWWNANLADPRAAAKLLSETNPGAILGWTGAIGAQVARGSALFLVTLVALFVMLRHGARLSHSVATLTADALGSFGERFTERLVSAVRGTVLGTVLVAIGEGTIIGAGYFVAGVPRPVLFGILTVAFAMLPFGAWLVFGIASIVLLIQGHVLAAGLLLAFGAVVMFVGDNVVQPALIGGRARLPFLFALIGTFGGLATLGLVGLFLGPVVMAALLLVLEEATHESEVRVAREQG